MPDNNYLIDARQLERRLGEQDLRVLDCRFQLADPAAGRRDYVAGHIPGAAFVDLEEDLSAALAPGLGRHPLPEAAQLAETFGKLGIHAGTTVVLYDDASGAIAARAWWLLRWLGHEDAVLLNGGFESWHQEGFATETGVIEPQRAVFHGTARDGLILSTEEIEDLGAAKLCLVDARAPERFAGTTEPLDRIGGHIPGARNLPFDDNLDSTGQWKARNELREVYGAVLGPDTGRAWSVMCGSGVTACHLVIGALISGYREPRVYVGSWSEWITDPQRAIDQGNPTQ